MARQMSTFKLQDKSLRLIARKKCTFKWQEKYVRLNGKEKAYV